MLEHFFTSTKTLEWLRGVRLSPVVDDLANDFYDRGYCPAVARSYLRIAGHFSHWLTLEGIALAELSTETMLRFRDEHLSVCRCSCPRGIRGR